MHSLSKAQYLMKASIGRWDESGGSLFIIAVNSHKRYSRSAGKFFFSFLKRIGMETHNALFLPFRV